MIKLPATIMICDREFSVEIKRSRKKAGGGFGHWNTGKIGVYVWDDTPADDILDTFVHEAMEMYWVTVNARFKHEDGKIIFVFDHDAFQQSCAFMVRLQRAVEAVNREQGNAN